MFGETTISYVKILNHPIETTIYKWMFQVPGASPFLQLFIVLLLEMPIRFQPSWVFSSRFFFAIIEKTMVNKRGVFQKTSYLSLVLNGPILYYRVLKGPGVSKRVITGEP